MGAKMRKIKFEARQVTAAEQGHIVQRVLVDGWSAAQAAAAYRLDEKRVARWVVAYRRHGMASLRNEAGAEGAPVQRIARAVAQEIARWRAAWVRLFGLDPTPPARCIVLRREVARPAERHDTGRRSLWN